MEIFSASQALCAGNSPVTGEFPSLRPATRSFMFSFICAWINGWVNNREAGDLRRHRALYDIIVMKHLETHGCLVSTVATDAQVLKHSSMNIHSVGEICIVLHQFLTETSHCLRITLGKNYASKWTTKLFPDQINDIAALVVNYTPIHMCWRYNSLPINHRYGSSAKSQQNTPNRGRYVYFFGLSLQLIQLIIYKE